MIDIFDELVRDGADLLTTRVPAVEFKDLVYKLPPTGFDPSCRPVRIAEIKDQRLPHEREAGAAPAAPSRARPRSNALPTKMNFTAGQARAAERSSARAQLNSGYLDAVSGDANG